MISYHIAGEHQLIVARKQGMCKEIQFSYFLANLSNVVLHDFKFIVLISVSQLLYTFAHPNLLSSKC
jgi:hypothetical protein